MVWNKYEAAGAFIGALIVGAIEAGLYLAFWHLWIKPRGTNIDVLIALPLCTTLGAVCGSFLGWAVGKSVEYRRNGDSTSARKICQHMGRYFFIVACVFAVFLLTQERPDLAKIQLSAPRTYPDSWQLLFVLFIQLQAAGSVWLYGHLLPRTANETVQITEDLRL